MQVNRKEDEKNLKQQHDYPLVLDPKHVGEILGCSYVTACRLMDQDNFPCIKMGKMRRVSRVAFFSWLNDFQKLSVK